MEGKKFYFCGIEVNCASENNIDKIVLDRLIKTKPCIVSMSNELVEGDTKLNRFIRDNYYLAKKFTYKRMIIFNDGGDNPSITIYLPHNK